VILGIGADVVALTYERGIARALAVLEA